MTPIPVIDAMTKKASKKTDFIVGSTNAVDKENIMNHSNSNFKNISQPK